MRKITNKRGKTSSALVFGFIIIALLLAAMVYGFYQQSARGEGIPPGGCETDPVFTITGRNALKLGTAVTGLGINYALNGEYMGAYTSGTTTVPVNSEIDFLINKSDYLDTKILGQVAKCGPNPIVVDLAATSTNTFRIFNTDGNPLTDNIVGGATNQSTSAAPINLDVRIDSTTDESTGNLVIVIEVANTTEVDSIKFSGSDATSTGRPEFYSANTANSIIEAFSVPALLDGESKAFTLTLSPESGQTIGTGTTEVYVTAYSAQDFADIDGKFITGVENADGSTKYEDSWDFDFMIA